MEKKLTALMLIVLMVGIGGLGGFLFGSQYSQEVKPPSEHQSIVDSMTIKDTYWNLYLEPKCVDSGTYQWGEISIKEFQVFEEGRTYLQSTWIWQRHGDTEVAMTIWGPSEDQTTCAIELGKLGGNPFEVKVKGVTETYLKATNESPGYRDAYYAFAVEIT